VTVREGEKSRSISKQRAIVKAVVLRALKGDTKAVTTLIGLLLRFQEGTQSAEAPIELGAEDLAILDRFAERAIATRKATAAASNSRNPRRQKQR
jgi:hypothetical protein